MANQHYHLCHLNIGIAKGTLDSPVMEGFVSRLDEFNNLAYASPGFVWHLQIDLNNPEHLAMYGEPGIIFNLSVWESLESLRSYVYQSDHVKMMQLRRQWFEEMQTPNYVLWWKPAGSLPTVQEGKERLAYLTRHGATEQAFGFRQPFPPPAMVTGSPL